MLPAHSTHQLVCLFVVFFLILPPAKVPWQPSTGGPCFTALHFTLPALQCLQLKSLGMKSLNQETAGKGTLVCFYWRRWVTLRRRHCAGCSDAALWSNTLELFSCCLSSALTWPSSSVTGVVAVLLESTYYPIRKWRTQFPFQRTRSMYRSSTDFYLSSLNIFAYPKCFVCGHAGSLW